MKFLKKIYPILVLIIIIIFIHRALLTNNKLFVVSDGVGYLITKIFLRDSLKAGEMPFWNPYTSIGNPFLADVQKAVLNPLNFLFFVFDAPLAFNLSRLAVLILAAVFMYLLMKQLHGNILVAVLSGCIFASAVMLGGSRMDHPPIVITIALFPLVFLLLVKFHDSKSQKWLAFSSVAMAFQFICGFTQIVLYFDILVFIYLVYVLFDSGYSIKKSLSLICKWAFCYVLLIAIQLFPMAVLTIQSGRDSVSKDYFSAGSYDFRLLMMTLFPGVYENRYAAFGDAYSSGMDIEVYIGIILIIYMLYQIIYHFRESKTKIYVFLMLTSFFYGMAPRIPVIGDVLYHVPLLNSFRFASRSLVIAVFFAVVLASMGLNALLKEGEENRILKINLIILTITAGLCFAFFSFMTQPMLESQQIYVQTAVKGMFVSCGLCVCNICAVLLIKLKKVKWLRCIVIVFLVTLSMVDVMRYSILYDIRGGQTEDILSTGASEQILELMQQDADNLYRSVVTIDSNEQVFSNMLNIAKRELMEVYSYRMYNSYITFMDKKLSYWNIQETVFTSLLLQQMGKDNGLVSMLGIHYIFDAWDHSVGMINDLGDDIMVVKDVENLNFEANPDVDAYAIPADWLKANTVYRVEVQVDGECPAVFYADYYNSVYDNPEQDGDFLQRENGIYETVISVEQIPTDTVFFRIVMGPRSEYKIKKLTIKEVEVTQRYCEMQGVDELIKVYVNNSARQLLYVPDEIITVDGFRNSWIEDGLTEVNRKNYIVDFDKELILDDNATTIDNMVANRNSVSARVISEAETFVNHSQLAYPGWKAYVDGKETKLYTVNNLIQGMVVPAGEHIIEFRYVPMDVYGGAIVTLLGIAAIIIWLFSEKRQEIIKSKKGMVTT